jgi:CRP-like cAMP-binding protein
MPYRKNFLLNRLDAEVSSRIRPHLATTELRHRDVLAEVHQRLEKVYFPHSGIISCVVELKGGGAIGTGMIGNDGAFGAGQALEDRVSLNHVVVQIAGTASVIRSDKLGELAAQFPALRRDLIKYEQFLLSQVQQTAACYAVHHIQDRTCSWLLRMHDLAGPEIALTQEFLAQMMGVRRTSITQIAGALQRAGMIAYRRGHIQILDLERIRASACECGEDLQSQFRRLFNLEKTPAASVRAV